MKVKQEINIKLAPSLSTSSLNPLVKRPFDKDSMHGHGLTQTTNWPPSGLLNYFNQTGFTLIEMMIALLISAFLIGGILQIFLSAKQSFKMQENLSDIQENIRFTSEFLSDTIRQAGSQGCKQLVNDGKPIKNAGAIPSPDTMVGLTPETAIVGHEWVSATNTRSPAVNAALTNLVAGTDVITITLAESCGGLLSTNMTGATADDNITIVGTNTCSLTADGGDAILISDCTSSDIIRTTTGTTASGSTIKHAGQALSKAYATGAEIMLYHEYSYYIRNGADNLPALWRRDNAADSGSNNPSELISGVDNLQITYGVETDAPGTANYGAPNYYTTANNVPQMSQVVSIRLSLLLASSDNYLAKEPVSYTFNGATITPSNDDKRIRRVMDSVIAIRNRGK